MACKCSLQCFLQSDHSTIFSTLSVKAQRSDAVPVLQLIAQLRKALGGGDGQNVILPTGEAGIVPVDPATSITIPRTPAQVTAFLAARSLFIVICFPCGLT